MIKFILNFKSGNDPEMGGEGSGGGKALLITTLLSTSLFFSCSIKKDTQSEANISILPIEEMQDSDGDGVPDKIENERGTNPFIADIPRIKVSYVSDVSMSGTFRTISDENNYISKEIVLPQLFPQTGGSVSLERDYYKALRSKVLANQVAQIKNIEAEKEDLITNEDLRTNILSSWENEKYYNSLESLLEIDGPINNESGKVSFNFKIKVTETTGVSDISNIKLKTFFFNYKKMEESDIHAHSLLKADGSKEVIKIYKEKEANPVSYYKIVSTDLATDRISENIKSRNEIGLKFTDYDYISSGIGLNYSTVLQKTLDRDAKIIFSNGIKTEIYFVSPLFTLESALKLIGKKFVKDNVGGILSIDGIETNASLPIDFDNISKSEFENGVWSIIGSANSLSDKLVEKGFYIISYAKVKDLLDASKSYQKYPEQGEAITKNIKLEKITVGDEVNIIFNSIYLNSFIESLSKKEIAGEKPDPCKFAPGRKAGCNNLLNFESNSCEEIIATPVESRETILPNKDFFSKYLNISNELGDKINFSLYTARNNIQIVFDKPLPLQRNNLTISLKSKDARSLRSGVIATTCPADPKYSINYYPILFNFTKEATIYTQTKY